MSRFFVEPDMVGNETIIIDSKSDIQHMSKVLRLREGDEIDVSDSQLWEYKCEIVYMDKNEIEVKILDKQKFAKEPETKVTLFQGIPKQNKMDLIVQKTVELGIIKIVPVFMDRTIINDKGKFGKKVERLNTIAAEAAKQSQRGLLPEVTEAIEFKDIKKQLSEFDMVLFPYENEENRTIKDALQEGNKPKNIAIIIGPEGGFSDKEASSLREAGTECVSLGKTILRTETAGIAALAMTMYQLEL